MALRGTLTHRKTRRLAAALKTCPAFAMGIIEALLHVTAEQRQTGDIGRLSNRDIADEMFYDGDPDALIEALCAAGYLDIHPQHRLIVHDWHEHADAFVHAWLARRLLLFANGKPPKIPHDAFNAETRKRIHTQYAERYPGIWDNSQENPTGAPDESGQAPDGPGPVPSSPSPGPGPGPGPGPSPGNTFSCDPGGPRDKKTDRDDSGNKKKREELLGALTAVEGGNPKEITRSERGKAAKALDDIRAVSPDVTVAEIERRAAIYAQNFDVICTPTALASHWSSLAQPPPPRPGRRSKPDRFDPDEMAKIAAGNARETK